VAHAVKALRGLRLCTEGREEGVTHLIVGGERRTLKVRHLNLLLTEPCMRTQGSRFEGLRMAWGGGLCTWQQHDVMSWRTCRCCWRWRMAPGC
jgi:hypothetical protein